MPIGWSGVANLANTEPSTASKVVADTEFLYPSGWGVAGKTVVATYLNLYPLTLFLDGSQGWWYDDNDTTTLFQDSAGTTPVTAVEQFVGLQLDKSKGLVLGPELVTNGDFSDGTTGWTTYRGTGTVTDGVYSFTPSLTFGGPRQSVTLVVGKVYKVTATVAGNAVLRMYLNGTSGTPTAVAGTTAQRTLTLFATATSVSGEIVVDSGASLTAFTVDNISVRELPGNHRYAPASGNRPIWSKRVNLLTKTEQFDDAAWTKIATTVTANSTLAPNGTLTADTLTSTGNYPNAHQDISAAAGNLFTFRYSIRKTTGVADGSLPTVSVAFLAALTGLAEYGAVVNTNTGQLVAASGWGTAGFSSSSIVSDGDYWTVTCTTPAAPATTTIARLYVGVSGGFANGTRRTAAFPLVSIIVWGADLRPANQATGTMPLYQRVNTSTDYDTNGFPGYLKADGIDDFMQTNSIDFTATDKITLCAGVRKLSDAALGVATELSAATASNNGAFALEAPAGASPSFNFASKGTTLANNTAQQFIAPITQTVTGIGDIGAARNTIRIGGVDSGVNTATQGTGNYGNYPAYFFRRGGTANPFNGYEYSNIAVGKLLTASQLASLEQYTYSKTINPDGAIYATQAGFSWNSATSSPNSTTYTGSRFITPIHERMRRCLLLDNGTVNYYLDPNDSTKKLDGTAANLTGADGQVMVEIPAFYTKRTVVGTTTIREISSVPATGFTLHPAFTKDGVDVPYRYYGAYDACVFDASASAYISGLNWDDNVSPNGVAVDTAADKLASVSGVYPMVGLSRAEFRTIAANRGSGWRQVDWTLWSAVQLLYLIEYQSFYSQNILGAGNTNGSFLTPSGSQNDSPYTIAGASNSLGNTSTNTTTGAGVNAKPGTSFMCYRGIENFYGNAWNWADGVIVNPDGTASAGQGDWWFTNNVADFSDTVRTNMTQITNVAATASGFISAIASSDNFFVGTSTSGGSSTTFLTDQLYASTAEDRAVVVGGSAADGASAGAFCVYTLDDASRRNRFICARLAF